MTSKPPALNPEVLKRLTEYWGLSDESEALARLNAFLDAGPHEFYTENSLQIKVDTPGSFLVFSGKRGEGEEGD